MNYLQRFHIMAILENPSKDDLSDSGGTEVAMELLKETIFLMFSRWTGIRSGGC